MAIDLIVRCDECDDEIDYPEADSRDGARDLAKRIGWTFGELDLCADCSEKAGA